MAAALGIHKADLKVVQVYEGSVIVEFEVYAPDDDPNPEETLGSLNDKFVEVVPTLGDELGAPIMQAVSNSGSVVTMEGYEDDGDFAGNGDGYDDLIDQFLDARDENLEEQEEDNSQEETQSPDLDASESSSGT